MLKNRKAMLGFGIMGLFVFVAIFGPLLVGDPQAFVARPLQPPSAEHWFGTTGQGQDVFAQTVAGTRSSLLIGLIVGFSVVAIGALVGTAAGYFGGRIDDALSTLINVFLIMPGLPLMVVLAAYLPPGPGSIALVLIVTGWSWSARVLRSQALALRQKDFVAAAMVAGESHLRIILVEILPNMISLLASACIGATIYAIAAQVGLEFLGLGEISAVTWGTNLYWATNDAALLTGSWWTFVPTGVCVALVGFALALINTALDEIGNPRLRSEAAFLVALGQRAIRPDDPTPVMRLDANKGKGA
jgi:peptide/nickel transport system permease protein